MIDAEYYQRKPVWDYTRLVWWYTLKRSGVGRIPDMWADRAYKYAFTLAYRLPYTQSFLYLATMAAGGMVLHLQPRAQFKPERILKPLKSYTIPTN